MKDVARLAGVSLGTVSNVLNHKSTVLPENKARVLKAVEELGFRTNMVARTLKTKSSNDIALIIPDINNPFYPELARGVEDAANKADLTVYLCNDDRKRAKERNYIESLIKKNICGLILVKPQISMEEIREISSSVAVVLVDVGMSLQGGCGVLNVDDAGGMAQGMELLYEKGHRKIAFVSGLMESLSAYNRYNAYLEFLQKKGIEIRPEYIRKGDYSWNSGYQVANTLMALDPTPTAVFLSNDLMAIGCIKGLQELGVQVPQDVSVLGYDNIEMSMLCSPLLTTIDQPKYEIGMKSVEMLLQLLDNRSPGGEDGPPRIGLHQMMPTRVVVRDSVARAKGTA